METTDEKIQQMQMIEQNLQNFLMQRQQFSLQLIEINSALDEIKDKKSAYKIVGNIMVLSSREDLEKDLNEKKKMLEIRISNLEKQEEKLKDRSKALRDEVMVGLKNKTK